MSPFSRAISACRRFFSKHPLLRDALVWSAPALIFGVVLRSLLVAYSPYAYWSKDSGSFFNFAYEFQLDGGINLDPKRRFLYPIFLLPVSYLPGAMLQWTAWLQHAMGLLSVWPIAYAIRSVLPQWRVSIIPATMFFAGLPLLIWYEHQVQAEVLFVSAAAWMVGGWAAWAGQKSRERACALFWWFFVPFAVLVLTKPSARFFWPGLLLAFGLAGAWRILRPKHWVALGVLFLAGLSVGASGQGARLLYTTAFPLTRLDSAKHAEYKEEIRDMVEPLRRNIGSYYLLEDEDFLKHPEDFPERPLWAALGQDDDRRERLYKDLALEGIRAQPVLFLWVGLQRVLASVNPVELKEDKLEAQYYVGRFEELYRELAVEEPRMLQILLGYRGDAPPFATVAKRLAPPSGEKAEKMLARYISAFHKYSLVVHEPQGGEPEDRPATLFRPTWLGGWLLLGFALSLFSPYRRACGLVILAILGYAYGVFLVGSGGTRYFAPAWPALTLLLALPIDFVVGQARSLLEKFAHR